MIALNDFGLRETAAGLRKAREILARRRRETERQAENLALEATGLAKADAALAFALDLIRADQSAREAEKRATAQSEATP